MTISIGRRGALASLVSASVASVVAIKADASAQSPARASPTLPSRFRSAHARGADEARIFRLDSPDTTLLLVSRGNALPEVAYWNARLPDGIDLSAMPDCLDAHSFWDIDHFQSEALLLPTLGGPVFGTPGLEAHREGRDWTAAFTISQVEMGQGRLALSAVDPVAKLGIDIVVVLATTNVVETVTELHNLGEIPLSLSKLVSGAFLLLPSVDTFRTFTGHWAREFNETDSHLAEGIFSIGNRHGREHAVYPALLATQCSFHEAEGLTYGLHLGWSGPFSVNAERLPDGRVLTQMGCTFMPGEITLQPGASFRTPMLYGSVSTDGVGGVTRNFHAHVRKCVLRWPSGRMKPRPVIMNTWEGNYFDLHQDRLAKQATLAAGLGVERFVLDDGWMKGRRSDRAGLGDWVPDPTVFPDGLAPLARHVQSLGMQFGLWIEPEAVNPDSDLFRSRPDCVLAVAGRPLLTSRHQYVLDLTQTRVSDTLFGAFDKLLRDTPIAYLKWDMNRDLVFAGGMDGRAAYWRQTQAVYALMERLHAAHPGLEIEACAGGGGRTDYGVLERAQRVWVSDCTDALERVRIQRGLGRFVPPEVMGCHISVSPNEETGRASSLDFRAAVALFGHLGLELDPTRITGEDHARLKRWIALYKRLRPVLHGGLRYATDPADGRSLMGIVSEDRRQAVYILVQESTSATQYPAPTRFPGLDPQRTYRIAASAPSGMLSAMDLPLTAAQRGIADGRLTLAGALLGQVGILMPNLWPQSAVVLECEAT